VRVCLLVGAQAWAGVDKACSCCRR
jgi:hypothetical protein